MSEAETRAAFLKLIGANWIWSPAQPKDRVPAGACYFRKTFRLGQVEFAQVHIACDNRYELYVNGRLAGQGADWRKMDVHDIANFLVAGNNVIAVKAINSDPGAAGLVARVIVKQRGGTHINHSTDRTWRTSVNEFANWNHPNFRDLEWLPATVYGPLGGVLPWGDEVVIADEGSRFLIDPEFRIERLVTDEQAGSLIAMAFNADGNILASREGGPLLLISDKDRDGTFESVTTFCSELKNVQGILSLGTRVYAVGHGPEGGALYQITDQDGDGRSDSVVALVKYSGAVGEHGPHTVRLGPDGLLYVLAGNFVQAAVPPGGRSPYGNVYEGDLVKPRYEDPNGHAAGLPSPGGTILRTDTSGSFVERFAAGFRNPYDFAFNRDGEIFTYDADMEWDIGAPWYRPTRINHVSAGAEFGWRSGWAKWPDYYLDSLPSAVDVGIGSPTGVVFYDHKAFPVRFQNSLFVGDWATGQIHAIRLERSGATYEGTLTTLVKGRPLNVTGLDVGPDGALYFSTGGRGTDGGIYRIRWTGTVPPEAIQFGQGIEQALRQPQFQSDWARRRVALIRRNLGDRWQTELARVLESPQSPAADRLRAVDLLTFFGPPPTADQLVALVADRDPAMRIKAIRLMGNRNDPAFGPPLVRALADQDAWVRRIACEAIAHRGAEAPAAELIRLLADEDRYVAFAARRALEKLPAAHWQEPVLTAAVPRTFLQGATGLLIAFPSRQMSLRVIERCESVLGGEVAEPGRPTGQLSDANFRDLLRVVQLALHQGEIPPAEVSGLTRRLVAKFPASDMAANRELVRLFAYLQPAEVTHALAQYLASDIPDVEKLHVAAYAPRISAGWQTEDKLTLLRYYEQVRGVEGGHSLKGYIEYCARDFFAILTLAERRQVLAAGESFPTSTLSVIATLPDEPGADVLAELRALDQRLSGVEGEAFARLRVGIVAVLGKSPEAESTAYLRDVYLNQPERRAPVAMSLTQNPDGENWPILVDSLRTIEGPPAQEVLAALGRVQRRPETSEPYRNAILLGLRSQGAGAEPAVRLLEHWTGRKPYQPDATAAQQIAAWQAWYAGVFPNELPAELPQSSPQSKWTYEELASFLETPEGRGGSPSRGEAVFRLAQCYNCHRFRGTGEGIGPDLTTVSQRFQRKEVLESIIHPSQVVSDQYASQIVFANGNTYTGLVARNPDGSTTVLQSDGQKVQIAEEDIEDIQPSKLSSMPEGLLNPLTLEQVADLFALLMNAPEPNVAGRSPGAQR